MFIQTQKWVYSNQPFLIVKSLQNDNEAISEFGST